MESFWKTTPGVKSSKLDFGKIFLSLLIFITVAGFELNYPLVYLFWGRWNAPLGIEAITSFPIALVGLCTFHYAVAVRSFRSVFLLFSLFVLWVIMGGLFVHSTSLNQLKNPVVLLCITSGSFFLFSRYWDDIIPILPFLFFVVFLFYAGFMLSRYLQGDFQYSLTGTSGVYLHRINVGGVLPTEAATASIYPLGYMLYNLRVGSWRIFSALGAFLTVSFIIYTGSKGAVVCFLFLLVTYILLSRRRYSGSKASVFLGLVMFAGPVILFIDYLIPVLFLTGESVRGFLSGSDSRVEIYSLLLSLIEQEPVWGVGIGQFFNKYYTNVAHHNCLGIAAELGVPAVVFFTLTVAAALYFLLPKPIKIQHTYQYDGCIAHAKIFCEMCFYVVLYIQLRGFFHDTWSLKETYFFMGAGLGLLQWIRSYRRHNTLPIKRSSPISTISLRGKCFIPRRRSSFARAR